MCSRAKTDRFFTGEPRGGGPACGPLVGVIMEPDVMRKQSAIRYPLAMRRSTVAEGSCAGCARSFGLETSAAYSGSPHWTIDARNATESAGLRTTVTAGGVLT